MCECVWTGCVSSSTLHQPCSVDHIAARGAEAPPRCCDWSPGRLMTRSRCLSLSTCRWKAWTFSIFGRNESRKGEMGAPEKEKKDAAAW